MLKDMKYLCPAILFASMLLGKKVLIKTENNKYLASLTGNKISTGHGNDYGQRGFKQGSIKPGWVNKCSLKPKGPPKQYRDVPGCGGVYRVWVGV